jgi:CheY-like chemotaxis protein
MMEPGLKTHVTPSKAKCANALRVLVVEDNADSAELLAVLLEFDGHVARVVHDGPTAILEAHNFRPDVVLCDIGLPGMDGYAVAERLTREQPAVKLIAITGYGQSEDRRKSLRAGFLHHLIKPLQADELRRILAAF